MLTVKKAAEFAGVSAGLVYEWVSCGLLACYRLGRAGRRGTIRIEEADLQAFLAAAKQAGRQILPPPPLPVRLRNLKLE